ncbi:MAG: zinc-dependent metalloprotease [Flavobacteriales bacterium]
MERRTPISRWDLLLGCALALLQAPVSAQPGQAQCTIPVVFHVLHENGPENINALQIADAIAILNAHFDEPAEPVEPPFQDLAADLDIAFALASVAPDGSPTNGIDRIESVLTNDAGAPSTYLNPWPRNRYLNIWVVRSLAEQNISYISPLPAQVDSTPCHDGVMIYHSYVGSIGTGSQVGKRTLTQAVGRFLNLKMVFEDPIDGGPCADDEVEDTPPAIPEVLCNSVVNPCADVVANEHNFMSSPYCSHMFTLGQRARVHACLNSSVAQRDQLASGIVSDTPACSTTGLEESSGDVLITARPNPFADQLIVEGLPGDEVVLELLDPTGRTVLQPRIARGPMVILEPGSLARGSYFVQVTTRNGMVVRKLIRE